MFTKGIELYEKINKIIGPHITFFANIYCNIAKSYSCLKKFSEAEKYYRKCILSHPLYRILKNQNENLIKILKINLEEDSLFHIDTNPIEDSVIKIKNDILLKYFYEKNKFFEKSIFENTDNNRIEEGINDSKPEEGKKGKIFKFRKI